MAGLLAFGLTVFDHLLSGRPLVWISPGDYGLRLHCKNVSTFDVTVFAIRCYPTKTFNAAPNASVNATVNAAAGKRFVAILKADEERDFPLMTMRSGLLDTNSKGFAPFVMVISWRKNSSLWLPQIPKVTFSSARYLRTIKSVK
jgi:hypothetical protein